MHFFTVTIDVSWLATEKGTRVRNKQAYLSTAFANRSHCLRTS
jgi:hypothetical protein